MVNDKQQQQPFHSAFSRTTWVSNYLVQETPKHLNPPIW